MASNEENKKGSEAFDTGDKIEPIVSFLEISFTQGRERVL